MTFALQEYTWKLKIVRKKIENGKLETYIKDTENDIEGQMQIRPYSNLQNASLKVFNFSQNDNAWIPKHIKQIPNFLAGEDYYVEFYLNGSLLLKSKVYTASLQERVGADFVTTIQCADSVNSGDILSNSSYDLGTPIDKIIQDIAQANGLQLGQIDDQFLGLFSPKKTLTLHKNGIKDLKNIIEPMRGRVIIENGILNIIGEMPKEKSSFYIGPDSIKKVSWLPGELVADIRFSENYPLGSTISIESKQNPIANGNYLLTGKAMPNFKFSKANEINISYLLYLVKADQNGMIYN